MVSGTPLLRIRSAWVLHTITSRTHITEKNMGVRKSTHVRNYSEMHVDEIILALLAFIDKYGIPTNE